MLRKRHLAVFAALFLAWPSPGRSQRLDAYKLPFPAAPVGLSRAQPGVTASSPMGYGLASRQRFIGSGIQGATRFGGGVDGSVSFGAGFFDARRLALEVVVNSASTFRSGFFARLYGAVKAHRVLANGMGFGVGLEGIGLTSDLPAGTDKAEPSVYAVVTKVQQLGRGPRFNQVTWNAGLGTARFAPVDTAGKPGSVGVFASAALRATASTALIADYTGQDLNLGLSFAPFRDRQIVITPVMADVLGRAGDGVRFSLGIGVANRGRKTR